VSACHGILVPWHVRKDSQCDRESRPLLSARLEAARASAGWSLYRTAKILGVKPSVALAFERGDALPIPDAVRDFAKAIGRSPSWFVGGA